MQKLFLVFLILLSVIGCTTSATRNTGTYGFYAGTVNSIPNGMCMLAQVHENIGDEKKDKVQAAIIYPFQLIAWIIIVSSDFMASFIVDTTFIPDMLNGDYSDNEYCSVTDCECSDWKHSNSW